MLSNDLLRLSLLLRGRLSIYTILALNPGLAVFVQEVVNNAAQDWQSDCSADGCLSSIAQLGGALRIGGASIGILALADGLVGDLGVYLVAVLDVNALILDVLVANGAVFQGFGSCAWNCAGVLLLLDELFRLLSGQANRVAIFWLRQPRAVFLLEVINAIDVDWIGSGIVALDFTFALFDRGVLSAGLLLCGRGRHLGQRLVLDRIRNLSLGNSCAAEGESAGQCCSGQSLWQTLHVVLLKGMCCHAHPVEVRAKRYESFSTPITIVTRFTVVTRKTAVNCNFHALRLWKT